MFLLEAEHSAEIFGRDGRSTNALAFNEPRFLLLMVLYELEQIPRVLQPSTPLLTAPYQAATQYRYSQ